MPPKKRPRGYRTQITESLLERVLKIVSDVVDWAQNVTTIPTLYRRPPILRLGSRAKDWQYKINRDLPSDWWQTIGGRHALYPKRGGTGLGRSFEGYLQ